MKHTPTPWKVVEEKHFFTIRATSGEILDDQLIANVIGNFSSSEENAEFIVRAVNNIEDTESKLYRAIEILGSHIADLSDVEKQFVEGELKKRYAKAEGK